MQRHLALLEERIVSHVVPLKPEAEFLGSYDSVSSLEAHIDQLIWFQMNGDITRSEFSEFATIINAKTGVSFGLEQLLEEKIKAHDATRPRPGSVQELFEEMLKKHEENEAKRPHPEKVNTPIYWMRAYTTMSAGHAGSTTEWEVTQWPSDMSLKTHDLTPYIFKKITILILILNINFLPWALFMEQKS